MFMTTDSKKRTISQRLRALCIDWNGAPMARDEPPRVELHCGTLRGTLLDAADAIDLLAEALKPFAEYSEQMQGAWSHRDDSVFYGIKRAGAKQIRYGDFRRALKVIEGLK
jgi:hypothetical protein